jgi:hypothetical protein
MAIFTEENPVSKLPGSNTVADSAAICKCRPDVAGTSPRTCLKKWPISGSVKILHCLRVRVPFRASHVSQSLIAGYHALCSSYGNIYLTYRFKWLFLQVTHISQVHLPFRITVVYFVPEITPEERNSEI